MEAGDLVAAVEAAPFENGLEGSSGCSDSDYESDIVDDAQAQWDENVANLERTIYMILCPIIGRFIGRRIAQNIWFSFVRFRWNKYQQQIGNS